MLIRNAEVDFTSVMDVRIEGCLIGEIGERLAPGQGEEVFEADGAALLPGLHDHHLHLVALASSLDSVACGPPQVTTADQLAQRLLEHASDAGNESEWIRGIGYHPSVAGDIDRDWLDRLLPSRPLRIQHRSGRLWILNSCALERLAADSDAPLERVAGRPTGRIYDADTWLRQRLAGALPSLARASRLLASVGVTGLSDTTPHNGLAEIRHFAAEQSRGSLLQDVLAMGDASLDDAAHQNNLRIGAFKIHLHEVALPHFDTLCSDIRAAHTAGRPVAIHCVTVAELVFALAALAEAGHGHGDRIEHASLAPPELLPMLAEAGVSVVTQPNFIFERGDNYLAEVPTEDQPWLYRGQGFLAAGIPLAAGTDAPFGDPDPWRAMQAAVTRRSRGDRLIGAAEALTPEQALALFLGAAQAPGGPLRCVKVGAAADLCLLDRPWREARHDLSAVHVALTLKAGRIIWRRSDRRQALPAAV